MIALGSALSLAALAWHFVVAVNAVTASSLLVVDLVGDVALRTNAINVVVGG